MQKQKTEIGLLPPQNIDAEMAVLGAMLTENNCIDEILGILSKENFYEPKHGRIYSAMVDLHKQSKPVDIISLSDKLGDPDWLEEIGGSYYLTELAEKVVSSAHAENYAKIVKEKAVARQAIDGCRTAIQRISNGENFTEIMDELGQVAVSTQVTDRDYDTGKMLESFDEYIRTSKEGELTGTTSGFTEIDKLLDGFQKSDLIVVGGRPSQGKTALVVQFGINASKKGIPVGIFSLEMPHRQITHRCVSQMARIDSFKIKKWDLTQEEEKRVANAMAEFNKLPLRVDDSSQLGVWEIRARTRRWYQKHGIRMIIVDYMQLMKGTGDNKEQELDNISGGLKALAKELDIPVIAVSQLSRESEQGVSKRPRMSNLRYSGAIEQHSDVVILTYRPDTIDKPREAEIIIEKNRNGPVGDVKLTFMPEYASFEGYIPE